MTKPSSQRFVHLAEPPTDDDSPQVIGAFDRAFDPPGRPDERQRQLASWYMPGVSDGIGDRLLMFDNTGAPSLELLRLRPELAAVPGFEHALRERVERLSSFSHSGFATVRTIEHLDGGEGLAVVSTYARGKRLSEMFRQGGGMSPAFAVSLIRQLTPALADLHRQGDDIAHGALGADRIVVSPDGRLTITDYVLGSALELLQLPPARLWSDFGILVPPTDTRAPRLDRRTDLIQLGLVALSALLGRRITPDEYPKKLAQLLDEFTATAPPRSQPVTAPLRLWLEQVLEPDGSTYRSAVEAQEGLGHIVVRQLPAVETKPMAIASPVDSGESIAPLSERPAGRADEPTLSYRPAGSWRRRDTFKPPPDKLDVSTQPAILAGRGATRREVTIFFALLAIAEAVMIGGLLVRWPAAAPAASLALVVESPQAGDAVLVDGQPAGVTPLELKLGSDVRSIQVLSRAAAPPSVQPRDVAPTIDAPQQPPATADPSAAIARAAARQRSGGLRLSSPIELKVLEGERVLGSSADGPIVTTAGRHELELINTAFGYRSRQVVDIKAGQIIPLTVSPPGGRLSINALPWAQVWINGKPVGETPLANIPAPVGEHEITFRHPQFGEHREKAIVRSGALTRVSATLER